MWKRLLATAALAACATDGTFSAQAPDKVDFARDVQPIFRQNCYGCHGPRQQNNNLRLDRRRDAMRGKGTVRGARRPGRRSRAIASTWSVSELKSGCPVSRRRGSLS